KVGRIADSLANTVGSAQGEQDMRETLRNLAQVTQALNETVRENRETIRDILVTIEGVTQRGQHDVDRILENVRVVTEEVRTLVAGSDQGQPGTAGEVRTILDKVNNASSSLEKTLQNLEQATNRLEKGEGTLGRLSKDEKLINQVEDVAENVGDMLGGLNRLQTIVSLRSDYQFRSQTVKSFVELRLQPREDKYYSFEIVNDPRGLTRIEQIDVDTTNPNDPPHYREVRTVTSNTFRFSLQFAQRFGPLVGRFGIKESTGGVGLDLLLLDDYFELTQDLFGFGEVVQPRWRVGLGYAFLSRLWLLGGVDDIFSPDRREYFVGLQLRFNDQDLKNLLPFAPSP
ncbi:MAG TPA: MCE family protein, partial [Polyangiaceae bacterium]|nr:MCE family protein [Polyangiaceae bacterium]